MTRFVSADLLTPVNLPPLHRRLLWAGARPRFDANTLTIQQLDVLPGNGLRLQPPNRLQGPLPGVILWRGFVAGENQIQLCQYLGAKLQLHRAQRCLQLRQRARPTRTTGQGIHPRLPPIPRLCLS